MDLLELREVDEVGRHTRTYLVSKVETGDRIDHVPSSHPLPLVQRLLAVFLPAGYPNSVSSDYSTYQVFDSLQAFSSAIAGLIASRAVLQGLGVGDENATATAAMLLNVLQESMGRIGTIAFAHWASRRIEADCKTYRLLADVFNDCSFVMDCLSPSMPKLVRIPLLCTSTVCRAICGVAGGSSKAILSAHFAQANNLGELNAKDSSQETVISLLGMWAGGAVVSRINSPVAIWGWLFVLVAIHLVTNYAAVSAVIMRTLNRQRTNLAFLGFMENGMEKAPSPREVAKIESIFGWPGSLLSPTHFRGGCCEIGASLQELLTAIDNQSRCGIKAAQDVSMTLRQLLVIFQNEEYVLWPLDGKGSLIFLKDSAGSKTKLKAWFHALNLEHIRQHAVKGRAAEVGQSIILVKTSLEDSQRPFEVFWTSLATAGWDLSTVTLEVKSGYRLQVP